MNAPSPSGKKSSGAVFGVFAGAATLAILIVFAGWLMNRSTKSQASQPDVEQHTTSDPASPQVVASPSLRTSATPEKMASKLSAEDAEKIKVLSEILSSKNDNDPRLDTDFKNLSPTMKQALSETYAKLPAENRNQKGTVVFLLGRSINSAADIGFLSTVLNEPPCLSLENCSRPPNGAVDEHASMASDITVVYPQLVAVKSIAKFLNATTAEDPGLAEARKAAIAALENAQKSDQQRISAAAAQALQSLNH